MKLGGALNVTDISVGAPTSARLEFLAEAMEFPDILGNNEIFATEPPPSTVGQRAIDPAPPLPSMASASMPSPSEPMRYWLRIGPRLTEAEITQATEVLTRKGIPSSQTQGRGPVSFIRLLEGVYPKEQARQRLADLKMTLNSAFLLRDGDQMAVYAGSFHRPGLADRLAQRLSRQQVVVSKVPGTI